MLHASYSAADERIGGEGIGDESDDGGGIAGEGIGGERDDGVGIGGESDGNVAMSSLQRRRIKKRVELSEFKALEEGNKEENVASSSHSVFPCVRICNPGHET